MLGFGASRESEVLDFHQRNGENMKKAWDRISEAHKRIMPWIPIKIVLRNFYHGLFRWCKHSLDIIAEGDFLECDEARALDIIHGLSSYFVYDHGFDTVIDRLATIEKRLDALDIREGEKPKPGRKDILEIEDDWEPFVRISISNQDFLAYCDIGSMVSTMPKVVHDSLNLHMVNSSFYHEHANGDVSKIQGKVKDVQVTFFKKSATVDFFIMEPNQGNIVLGRDFLRAMKGFIDIGKGQIHLRGKAKGTYPFPRKNKDELLEEPFECFNDSDDFGEF
jgi:hypothetical protein